MAKFIKSKFKVLWGTVFAFFYGFFANDVVAQEENSGSEESQESESGNELSPGAIAAAVAAAAASALAASSLSVAARGSAIA